MNALLTCTCGGVRPGLVEPASLMKLITSQIEAPQARLSCVSSLEYFHPVISQSCTDRNKSRDKFQVCFDRGCPRFQMTSQHRSSTVGMQSLRLTCRMRLTCKMRQVAIRRIECTIAWQTLPAHCVAVSCFKQFLQLPVVIAQVSAFVDIIKAPPLALAFVLVDAQYGLRWLL